jgi:beta-glucanase (GH16 family)
MMTAVLLSGALLCGCSGGAVGGGPTSTPTRAAAPTISTTAGQNGAVVASLATTTSGAALYYTIDGSTPTASSPQYFAPFLVASSLTVKAIATATGDTASNVTSQSFTINVPSGTLVWSDEFTNSTGANAQPNPLVWTYDTGPGSICCGNSELEYYCAPGSSASPCDAANPNVYADTSGILHIVARQPSAGVYTSARLKSQGLFSFQYGRIEARMMLPESQGMWPAFWLLGNNST